MLSAACPPNPTLVCSVAADDAYYYYYKDPDNDDAVTQEEVIADADGLCDTLVGSNATVAYP